MLYKSNTLANNVTAGEKFEMSQSEIIKNLHTEGPVHDEEHLLEKSCAQSLCIFHNVALF